MPIRPALAALICAALAACTTAPVRDPVPVALTDAAQPVGFERVRFWGDVNDPALIEQAMIARAVEMRDLHGPEAAAGRTPKETFLAISGGGQYGAFTAGVLTAWTETGERPEFSVVSGISTGSIIAPFAFLGPKYDPVLREVYTETRTEDLLEPQLLTGLFGGSSLANTQGLQDTIAEHVTADFLAEIAAAHEDGRRLFMGTTNIDAGRSVIWNMGEIASRGTPEAVDLFRKVILASAAIPVAFPPVFFDVEANGETFREMHVDGGVTSQVNVLSPQVPAYLFDDLIGFHIDRDLYVIVNGAVRPPAEVVEATVPAIAGASIDRLWYAQAVGDLYRIHAVVQRDEVGANYGWIPAAFDAEPTEEFDPVFMGALFELGAELLRSGELWRQTPPGYTARGSTAVERGERTMPTLPPS